MIKVGMLIILMSLGLIKQKKTQCVILLNGCRCNHTIRYAYNYYLNLYLTLLNAKLCIRYSLPFILNNAPACVTEMI